MSQYFADIVDDARAYSDHSIAGIVKVHYRTAHRVLGRRHRRLQEHIARIRYSGLFQDTCDLFACRGKGVVTREDKRLFAAAFCKECRQFSDCTAFNDAAPGSHGMGLSALALKRAHIDKL